MPVYFLNNEGEHKEYKFGQLLPFAFGLEQGEKYLVQ
jgi:cytidine deaminase